MTWSLSASGQVPSDMQTQFLNDVVGVFKKYGASVHNFLFTHPEGQVTTGDVTGAHAAQGQAQGSGVAEPAPAATPTSTQTPATNTTTTGGDVPPFPRDPNTGEALPPSPPPIDLATTPTATKVPDAPAASAASAPAASASTSRLDTLEADVADMKTGLASILAALNKGNG